MIFSTFYFSGTGNTEWVVREFNSILEKKGHQGRMYSIEEKTVQEASRINEIISSSDFIGFANPIYGANIPPIMRSFIEKALAEALHRGQPTKKIYMLNTFGYVNAFGPIAAKRLLCTTDSDLISYVNVRMCNNISTPKYKTKPLSPDKLEEREAQARVILHTTVERILANKRSIGGIGPYLIPGIIIRSKSEKGIRENYLSLGVNPETCSRCMLCVKQCPTQSIKYSDGAFIFSPACTACMRCYNFCPTYSISLDGAYASPVEFERYRGPIL